MLKSGKKPSSRNIDVVKKEKHMRCLSHPVQSPSEEFKKTKEKTLKDSFSNQKKSHRKPSDWGTQYLAKPLVTSEYESEYIYRSTKSKPPNIPPMPVQYPYRK
jgi:hypothetical protein